MKRFVTLTLLLTLLTALPARAVTYFDDGEKLHRDPFCVDAVFSFDSFYASALQLADDEEARAHGVLCESCTALVPQEESTGAPVVWYYNPDGGKFLHRDAECPSVSQKYKPMTGTVVAKRPDWVPENPCNFCGFTQQVLRGPSDTFGWNATPAEKAAFLPGVWTEPSAEAVHFSIAASAASDFLQKLRPQETYVMSIAHYDHGGPSEGENRATYKVIVTTLLRHPFCIVYVDALTGEVYHHQMAAEFAQ